VAYISVVILVLANTAGLVVATLLPRYASEVLGVSAQNIVFVAAPAAIGIWLAMRIVSGLSVRVSPWWSIGGSFAAMLACVTLLAFVGPLGDGLQSLNPLGLFDPGPFGSTSARIMLAAVLGPVLAFAFTFVNIIARTIVNERIPRDMQGRVLAAQTVLTNLASIPPILLTGLLADAFGVEPMFIAIAIVCGIAGLYYSARNLAEPRRAY
jgi:MFS family permease